MSSEETPILDGKQIDRMIVRMAHEIYENYYTEKQIVLIGIVPKGDQLAARLAKVLGDISPIQISHFAIELHKDRPLSGIAQYSGNVKDLKNKVVLLVDDVLNSGRTLIYSAKFLLDAEPKKLATVALIERTHRRFPVRADFVGLSLSTNLKEHIRVELASGKEGAYLE